MKKLTADDLRNLKWGDKVYRISGRNHRGLRFVGFMPGSPCYLIFCDGEYLTHLYINERDNSFHDEWYGGEYDSTFIGFKLKMYYLKKAQDIEDIYIKSL